MKLDYKLVENLVIKNKLKIKKGSCYPNKKRLLEALEVNSEISNNSMNAVMKILNKYFDIQKISGSHGLIIKEVYEYVRYDVEKIKEDMVAISLLYCLVEYLMQISKKNDSHRRFAFIGYDLMSEIIGLSAKDLYTKKVSIGDGDSDIDFIISSITTFICKFIKSLLIKANKANLISCYNGYYVIDEMPINSDESSLNDDENTELLDVKRPATEAEIIKIEEETELVKIRRGINNINFSKKRNKIYEEIQEIVGFKYRRTYVFELTDEFIFNGKNYLDEFYCEVKDKITLNTIILPKLREHAISDYDKNIDKEKKNKQLIAEDADKKAKQSKFDNFEEYIQEFEKCGCDVTEPVYRHVYNITEDRDEMLRKIDIVLNSLYTIMDNRDWLNWYRELQALTDD